MIFSRSSNVILGMILIGLGSEVLIFGDAEVVVVNTPTRGGEIARCAYLCASIPGSGGYNMAMRGVESAWCNNVPMPMQLALCFMAMALLCRVVWKACREVSETFKADGKVAASFGRAGKITDIPNEYKSAPSRQPIREKTVNDARVVRNC